ncbi:unnamed protein product, partial [marine sediment metagenome]
MGTEIERLSVLIEANTKSYERSMQRLERKTSKAMNASARSVKRLNAGMGRLTTGAKRFAAVAAVAFITRDVKRYADVWTEAGNKMRAAGEIAGRSGRSLSAINALANQSRSGLEDTVDLYAKLLRSTKAVAES